MPISYVGPPELHDGIILRIEANGDECAVFVRDVDDVLWKCAFDGVTEVSATKSEGMILLALAESLVTDTLRRFVFINWDDEGEASLHIVARDFHAAKAVSP